ncbi:unnamed protein product [Closterium sp. NIES-54]
MTSLHHSGGSGDGGGGSSGSGGGRTSSRCRAVRWGVSGGGQMHLQRRPRESLPPQQIREWYASRSGGGGSSGTRCIEAAALGASESALPGTAPAEALHTFTLDSSASRCFFHDSTTLTPLSAPVPVRLADPSRGPVLARSSTVLPCPAVPSGSLSGLHLPSFSTNLVSTAALQDAMVTTTTPGGQRVSICTCTRTGHHLATFTRRPGSSLYTLATEPPQVVASAQVSASGQVAPPCSCRLLSHQTLLWHHCLGHPSLPHLRGMHSHLLISGLRRSLPPLPPLPTPPCLPCVEGRQRAAPHSSSFPPTTAPLQTLHMDVWGPARVNGQGRERYFLLVVDNYTRYTTVFPLRSKGEVPDVLIPWIRAVRLQRRERFGQDLHVLRLHSDRGSEFSSDFLWDFCRGEGILQSFTLPDSPQQNGIAECRIGLVVEVARTSMIHAAAPHFQWPFAVRYATHQLNLWPRVSLPETLPTLRWAGKVGDASVFRVWGSRAFVRDTSADKLSARVIPCDFTFDESVPFYRLFPYRSAPPPPPPLFLTPSPHPVDPLLGTVPVEVAGDSGAARGAASGGAASRGAEPRGAESEGAGSGGVEPGGAEPGGAGRAAGAGDSAAGAGGAGVTTGAGGTGGAAETGGVGGAGARDPTEPGAAVAGGAGAGGTSAGGAGVGEAGAGGTGAGGTGAGGAGAGGAGASGARAGGTGAGGAGAGEVGAVDPGARGAGSGGAGAGGAGGTGAGGVVRPRPYFVPLLQQVLGVPSSPGLTPPLLCPPPDQSQPPLQPASPLPAPSPYTEQTGGLTERREPESRPASPVRTGRRVPRPRPPSVPSTHAMALRPSSVPLHVPLLTPLESSLPQSTAASALVDELVDFVAACRLDYATALVAESESASPPFVGGECALGTDVLKDRQEEFECLTAAVPRFASMLLAPEGDQDAPDILTPRSYAEAITGFRQRQGVDYFQTFSPTPKMTTLRVLLHVVAQRDYELHSLDFSTAFLQGSLHEEIWLRRPPGFTGSFPAGTQWSLRRPVYGLRQAPREWHDTLRTTLAALGFTPSTADPSLFLRTDSSLPPFYVLVYVDDHVFATVDTEALTLVLQRFGFHFSLPQPTPLYTGHSLSAPPSDESMEPSGPYPELVGCLMYLMTCTRPDLAYPLSLLARYMALDRHRKVHRDAAKRVLRYLCSTSGIWLVLGGRGPVVLTSHADASWVDDSAMQRSSQGYTFSLGSGSVSWRSTRSSSVLSSSCEAEIYAGAMAAQELRWLTYLLTDLGE